MATGEGGRQVHGDGEAPTRHHLVWLRPGAFVQLKTKQICKLNVNKTTTTKLIKVKNIKNPQNLNQQYEVSMTSLSCSKHKVICGVQWQAVPSTLCSAAPPSPGFWDHVPSTVDVSILGEETTHTYKAALSSVPPLLEPDCFGKLIKPHTRPAQNGSANCVNAPYSLHGSQTQQLSIYQGKAQAWLVGVRLLGSTLVEPHLLRTRG